ncbi:hypothetical protein DTO013F2_10189 [Penicillium roqueforti]|nr:hypothetical protein DTO013F2_10189 [Penicillium roqueforti]KAI3232187.1 hypothetical protein CBS147310_5613 [Penicillium roqueforti]KAI3246485.1 hypothetical protein DTO012A9_4164 [Penicillium roqueforti]
MTLFPNSTLRAAAQPALKGLATRCLKVILFKCWKIVEFMDPDARSLLGICCDLLSDGFSKPNIVRLDKHKIIEVYTDCVLDVLSARRASYVVSHYLAFRCFAAKLVNNATASEGPSTTSLNINDR